MTTDLLEIAGLASEALEKYGFVACGRRKNGVASVDFWTRDGVSYRHELDGDGLTVDEVVAACLAIVGHKVPAPPASRVSHLN